MSADEGTLISVGVRAGQPAGDLTILLSDGHHIDMSWQEAVEFIVALGRIVSLVAYKAGVGPVGIQAAFEGAEQTVAMRRGRP